MQIESLGWNPLFEENFQPFLSQGLSAARVIEAHKHVYKVMTEDGALLAKVTGKMRYGQDEFPVVGDWVAVQARPEEGQATIHAVLPRSSKFSRKAAGKGTKEQVIVANVDTVFLVSGLNRDFNLRRIERYLAIVWESGATPVIVLNKADLCDDAEEKHAKTEAISFGVPIHVVSAATRQGLDELAPHLAAGKTVAFLGSSGVGKSTLINALIGSELQKTNDVRESDDRGKHTTSFNKLIVLPNGGLVIDTPGLRELAIWSAEEGLSDAFTDIEEAASHCKFGDCSHETEPGCAVKQAVEDGRIDRSRLEAYQKLQKESDFTEDKKSYLARKETTRKNISQFAKDFYKTRPNRKK